MVNKYKKYGLCIVGNSDDFLKGKVYITKEIKEIIGYNWFRTDKDEAGDENGWLLANFILCDTQKEIRLAKVLYVK